MRQMAIMLAAVIVGRFIYPQITQIYADKELQLRGVCLHPQFFQYTFY